VTLFYLLGCKEKGVNMNDGKNNKNFKNVSAERWSDLSQKNIFMGHHSVGYNILDGIREISSEDQTIKLNIIETDTFDSIESPVFAHYRVGKNLDPKSKIDHFKEIIEVMNGKQVIDIAFFKLCYVDIDTNTNINDIFNYYVKSMSELQKNYPMTQFVHFTVPLKASPQGFKTWIKRFIGYPVKWTDPQNIKRNKYNRLIIKKYKITDPIFDLAANESSYPNGKREYFKKDGEKYYSLVSDYTGDGGHLNKKGRKIIARELLIFLANL
jgi:hypothetical protein